MPIVTVDMIAGYEDSAKQRLGQSLTQAVLGVVNCPADLVTVILRDVPPANYFRGGTARKPGPALPDSAQVVRDFLTAMEARDLPRATGFLGDGFTMTFPGGVQMVTLEALIDWAKPRYRFVRKTYERFDAMGPLVYCFGTLAGEWPDGTGFDGVRFIDRFELSGGKLIRQDVWNDLAEVRSENQTGGAA